MPNLSDKKTDLSIIIVNYNLAKEIEDCLNSLLNKTGNLTYEIIIVDNNSPDKSLIEVEKKFVKDNIRFFYRNENLGFGQGCNYGFSKATGEYICFLNPDTLIVENIFQPVINLFGSDNSIGIIGPKQRTKKSLFDFSAGFFTNILFELFNLLTIGVYFEAFIVSLITKLRKQSFFEVDWILGACIFIRVELFKTVNGFDKDYFMFFEETDLCKRVADKGFKIIYYPQLQINHLGSASGKKDYSLFTKRIYSSKYIFISKHYKSLNKVIMKFLLFLQLFSQIILWFVLFPLNKNKSQQKLDGFFYLLRHRMKL